MNAAFELQLAVGAAAFDQSNNFLETANARGIGRKNFYTPTLSLRIPGVHSEHVRHKQSGFVAACARANFENDVSLVIGVFRQKQELEIGLASGKPFFESDKFLMSHRLQVRIGFIANHGFGLADSASQIAILAELRHDFAQFAVRAGRFLVLLAVGNDFRTGQLPIEFFVTSFGRAKSIDEDVRESHYYTVSASSSARMAISSCVSSGSFVVIF